ncbi:ThiF family adenylyltransferase [Pelomonas sp. CA6]|uniref:ThiF family adenylyltransferase n=1 Tax=Pelomonas sp. CA6 TaxID=2907999 RepID=UPI001F4C1E06|nr:ThiF family adenylyltransferase [Pelomonas sp. CA6]MCH7344150.1 ThiF family adenylyltransferase [Pelomonas sp. CA6]
MQGQHAQFDYDKAFSRNIGWVTRDEQAILRKVRVAIAGQGGVGGVHALTLARLGISHFHLADFDSFDVHNFNRQAGAFMSTVGRPKAEVMAEMIRDINPEAEIRIFDEGVNESNLDAFLDGIDVYVDGIDFFAMKARRMLFNACERKGIPALTAAPLGMGVALLYFKPGAMSFERYFRLEGQPEQEQYARFIAGLSPAMLQRRYLVDPQGVNFKERRGPSTPMACELCAGVMATAVLKVVLRRGDLRPAPWGMHFDAYRQRLHHTWRPWGNANPMQKLLIALIRPVLRG